MIKDLKEYNLEHYRKSRDKNPEKQILKRAYARALLHNMEFNLEVSDIVIPTHCPILGIELILPKGQGLRGGRKHSVSIDRIDNTKGYVKGNVQILSNLANTMKSNASPEELMAFAQWVIKNQEEPQ